VTVFDDVFIPNERVFLNGETDFSGVMVERFASYRMKVLRLIENLVTGAGAVGYLIESMHGAGPPTAQRIMIGRQAKVEDKIAQVQKLLDMLIY